MQNGWQMASEKPHIQSCWFVFFDLSMYTWSVLWVCLFEPAVSTRWLLSRFSCRPAASSPHQFSSSDWKWQWHLEDPGSQKVSFRTFAKVECVKQLTYFHYQPLHTSSQVILLCDASLFEHAPAYIRGVTCAWTPVILLEVENYFELNLQ